MQGCELVELAAVAAVNAGLLVEGVEHLSPQGMERYWSASKCRLDRWSRAIKRYSQRCETAPTPRHAAEWRALRGVVEEIFLGEVLARVWTAISAAHDQFRATCEIEPIARSVLVGQSEARNRALNLLVQGQGIGLEEAVDLNRLRRRTERWTDLLLGSVPHSTGWRDLAFEAERAEEFAAEFQSGAGHPGHAAACQLALVSLRSAFQKGPYCASPNAEFNARIAEGIITCLPPDVFDSTGQLKSLWLMRIETKTNDTQGMIDELVAGEAPAALTRPAASRRADGPHSLRARRF